MIQIVLLDTGPLGLLTHPKASRESDQCNQWVQLQLRLGIDVMVPGISDYELRREMLLNSNVKGLQKLDALRTAIAFLPITTDVMDKAADLWAQARRMGKPTASDPALDGDMILSAQATLLKTPENEVLVATTNVKHLTLFCNAILWQDIN